MPNTMDKSKILSLNKQERTSLLAELHKLTPEQMTQPGLHSDWSVKDDLAHIVVWEQRMIQWLTQALAGEIPAMPAPGMTWDDLDRLNEQDRQASQARSLEEVWREFESSYLQAVRCVEGMSDQELFDPNPYPWRRGSPLWHIVEANMWEHYREHREILQAWQAGTG